MYVKPGLGPLTPNPPKKALENRYRAEMHLHSPIFKDSSLKKNMTNNFNACWKMQKRGHRQNPTLWIKKKFNKKL